MPFSGLGPCEQHGAATQLSLCWLACASLNDTGGPDSSPGNAARVGRDHWSYSTVRNQPWLAEPPSAVEDSAHTLMGTVWALRFHQEGTVGLSGTLCLL